VSASATRSALPEPGALPASSAWLHGRGIDLLVGCGLGYLLMVPLLLFFSGATGITRWPATLVILFSMLVSGPHYGATILRVYEQREDRQRYVFFAVYVTIALAIALVVAVHNALVASVLITIYLTWSPWHFSGQNYGLAVMFLRRSGTPIDPISKRALYASFLLSAGLAILAIHSQQADFAFAPTTISAPNTPVMMYGHLPSWLTNALFAVLIPGYVAALAIAGWRLRRRAPLSALGPAVALVFTQALWFTIPALLADWTANRQNTLAFAAIWVSAAHAAQYLWVTSYYARRSGSSSSSLGFFGKAFAAGSAVTVLPGLIMAPTLLGRIPWDAGLAAAVFSVVNLHHFILDGAIWKLREGPVARVLLRQQKDQSQAHGPSRHPRLRALAWGLGAASVFIPLTQVYENQIAMPRATHSRRIELSADIQRWIGRETTVVHRKIGHRFAQAGQVQAAIAHFERANALFPTPRAWAELGEQYTALASWSAALRAFDQALALDSEFVPALLGRARLALRQDEAALRAQAVADLEKIRALEPDHPEAGALLRQARISAAQAAKD